MNRSTHIPLFCFLLALPVVAQEPELTPPKAQPRFAKKPVVERFDEDRNGRLEGAERVAARKWMAAELVKNPPRRRGGGAAPKSALEPRQIDRKKVPVYPDRPLYDLGVIRTVFLDFAEPDWAKEMALFYRTDVEVPARMTVDGKVYPGVGVHFRGSSSYFTIVNRKKKSFSISLDYTDRKQRLQGHSSLNLLNGHADPSFLRTVLFAHIAGQYLPTAKACFVHLVVNGESYGLYVHDQQLNKDFLEQAFQTRKGARWKIGPNFKGESALAYQGPAVSDYETKYELKSATSKKAAWKGLIELCRTLSESTPEELETRLPKLLDIDHTLWFLALDNVLMDGDGYHYRGSDYALYLHPSGRFYPLFRDSNESFQYGGGPGGFGRKGQRARRGSGADMDPLALVQEERAPLASKLLAVPKWRAQYLRNCRALLDAWMDWDKIGPLVAKWKAQIDPLVRVDDKALYGHKAFLDALGTGSGRTPGLEKFVTERRAFLLAHPSLKRD